jgi:DNA gyrase/topoisomerase IV subunit B
VIDPEWVGDPWATDATGTDLRWVRTRALDIVVVRGLSSRFAFRDDAGVQVEFLPDPAIFGGAQPETETLRMRLRGLAFLHPGATFSLVDERNGARAEYRYDGGSAVHVEQIMAEDDLSTVSSDFRKGTQRPRPGPGGRPLRFAGTVDGLVVDAAVQWTDHPVSIVRSYAQGVRTRGGGRTWTAPGRHPGERSEGPRRSSSSTPVGTSW